MVVDTLLIRYGEKIFFFVAKSSKIYEFIRLTMFTLENRKFV